MNSRQTAQRRALGAVLRGSERFRTAAEIHACLQRGGSAVSLRTVYRTLRQLVESGEVEYVRFAGSESGYRRRGECRHHLICRSCRRGVAVAATPVWAWARRAADLHGFEDLELTAHVLGTCSQCHHPVLA